MAWYEREELRQDYEWLHDIMTLEVKGYEIPLEQRLKMAEPFKRKIREKLKRYNNRKTEDEIHYSEDGESCWYKRYYNTPFTEEEKQEFIEDNWKYINSPYDCTGHWFTRHIAVCNVHTSFGSKAVAYFFMGLDV